MAILLPQPNSETTQSNNFFGYGWGELGRVGEIVLWRRTRQNVSKRHLRFGVLCTETENSLENMIMSCSRLMDNILLKII